MNNFIKIFLVNFLGVFSLTALPFYIFIDKWTIDNIERTDIIARGPFLAGIFVLTSLIIFGIVLGIITILIFRKIMNIKSILIGISLSLSLFALLYFSMLFSYLFFPGSLVDLITPFGHYFYIAILILITTYLFIKFKKQYTTHI